MSPARSAGPRRRCWWRRSQVTASAPASRRCRSRARSNFADIAERLNPVVVNIDASARGRRTRPPDEIRGAPRSSTTPAIDAATATAPRRGTGTGFIIDSEGHILTNQHVIDGAERITVKLADGRSLRASVVGSDPDTDIALIEWTAGEPLPSRDAGQLRPAARG